MDQERRLCTTATQVLCAGDTSLGDLADDVDEALGKDDCDGSDDDSTTENDDDTTD